jgi:hypothetical protein
MSLRERTRPGLGIMEPCLEDAGIDRPDQRNGRVPSAFSYYWPGECGAPLEKQMTVLKSVMVATVLLAGGISLAIAQNGPATGCEHPVAGGAAGGGPGFCGYRHYRHLYSYYRPHRHYRRWRYY